MPIKELFAFAALVAGTSLFAGGEGGDFAKRVEAASMCPVAGEWRIDDTVSDEFDGNSLNKAKWWDFTPRWPGTMG